MIDEEIMRALEEDGEKLRQLTGEDHGPVFFYDGDAPPGTTVDAVEQELKRLCEEGKMTVSDADGAAIRLFRAAHGLPND